MSDTVKLTDRTLTKKLRETKILTLIDFWAEWCGPCVAMGPTLEELATKYKGKVLVIKVNIEEAPDATERYKVKSIPAMILLDEKRKEVYRFVGITSKSILDEKLAKMLAEREAKAAERAKRDEEKPE